MNKVIEHRPCETPDCDRVILICVKYSQRRFCKQCFSARRRATALATAARRQAEAQRHINVISRKKLFSRLDIQHLSPDQIVRAFDRWKKGEVELV